MAAELLVCGKGICFLATVAISNQLPPLESKSQLLQSRSLVGGGSLGALRCFKAAFTCRGRLWQAIAMTCILITWTTSISEAIAKPRAREPGSEMELGKFLCKAPASVRILKCSGIGPGLCKLHS